MTAGEGASSAALTGTPSVCLQECIEVDGVDPVAGSSDDPWKALGTRGYVLSSDGFGHEIVYGIDATFGTVLWRRFVASDAGVLFYDNLAGTIPFTCPPDVSTAIGQVGSVDVPSGGGNQGCFTYCVDPGDVAALKTSCLCRPITAAAACRAAGQSCGTVRDNCGNVVSCGHCVNGATCNDSGVCERPAPPCHGLCQ